MPLPPENSRPYDRGLHVLRDNDGLHNPLMVIGSLGIISQLGLLNHSFGKAGYFFGGGVGIGGWHCP